MKLKTILMEGGRLLVGQLFLYSSSEEFHGERYM